jgi:hypothetical protein
MSDPSNLKKRGHAETDEEGIEVGRRVRLPHGAQPPIRVYINGIEQEEGDDYLLDSEGVLFHDPIIKEGKLSGVRWLMMTIGLFGSYRKHETVDVEYRIDGKPHLASDLEVTEK